MSCQEEDFKEDVTQAYGQGICDTFGSYIERAFDDKDENSIDEWVMSFDVEKHDALNESYHFSFCNEKDDIEVCCTYYTGIDVGCELVDYSLSGKSLLNTPRYEEIVVSVKPNWSMYEGSLTDKRKTLIETVLKNHEPRIMQLLQKQGYDNYVTGGGTFGTNKHYQEEFQKLKDKSIHWLPVYEKIEVDRNIR